MKEYILPNYNPKLLIKNKKYISELYNEYGVVIFPNFFKDNKAFSNYINDLSWTFKQIILQESYVITVGSIVSPWNYLIGHSSSCISINTI